MARSYTDFQLLVHSLPEEYNIFLGGGRGGAKSTFKAQYIRNRALRYRDQARILYFRQGPYSSLADFIGTLKREFDATWGHKKHHLNRSNWLWETPTGAHIQLGILPDGEKGRKYYERRYQGNSFTDILGDEVQQFSRPENIDLLGSNLRGTIPCRQILSANPGGIGHQWLAERYVFNGVGGWLPFDLERDVRLPPDKEKGELVDKIIKTRRTWISCPSTYKDNPFNGPDYLDNLAQACGNDPDLLLAWITGSWKISRGAFFASVLDNPYIQIEWPIPQHWEGWWPLGWHFWLAHDHGTAAPSVTYVMARSPGAEGPDGLYYPRGSTLILDEYACARSNDLGKGFGWTVPQIADPIKKMAARWRIPAQGVGDDAMFGNLGHSSGTIADEYSRVGIVWRPARKGLRNARHLKLKRLLKAAGRLEEPGIYVSKRCKYWWATVPFLVHDPKDPEDVLKCDTDHGLDASEYGLDGDAQVSSVMEAW